MAAWDCRSCGIEGVRFLWRVLRPLGNVSQGQWNGHQSTEFYTQRRFGRCAELHSETINRLPRCLPGLDLSTVPQLGYGTVNQLMIGACARSNKWYGVEPERSTCLRKNGDCRNCITIYHRSPPFGTPWTGLTIRLVIAARSHGVDTECSVWSPIFGDPNPTLSNRSSVISF